jgi:hypothetical protein
MRNNTEGWQDLEKENPEAFNDIMLFFRKLKRATEGIQMEMAICLLQDDKFKQAFLEAENKPEEYAMKVIDANVRQFVSIMPLALANGVNPIMTLLSSHSAVTGDTLIDKIITRLNEEGLEESDESDLI